VNVNFFDAERKELHNLCKLIWHATAYVVNYNRNYCDKKKNKNKIKNVCMQKKKREIVLLLSICNNLKSQ